MNDFPSRMMPEGGEWGEVIGGAIGYVLLGCFVGWTFGDIGKGAVAGLEFELASIVLLFFPIRYLLVRRTRRAEAYAGRTLECDACGEEPARVGHVVLCEEHMKEMVDSIYRDDEVTQ